MSSSMEKKTEKQGSSIFQKDLEYLRQIRLFSGLDYECLKLLAMLSKRVDFIEGDLLTVQGEDEGNAYLLISGTVRVIHKKDGVDHLLDELEPGRFIGGLALLGKSVRLFTLQAAEKTTALRLSREGFLKTMQQFPDGIARISTNLVAELMFWDQTRLAKIKPDSSNDEFSSVGISLL